MTVLISVNMELECIVINQSLDGLEMYWKMFTGGFPPSCRLIKVNHHLKNHLGLVPGWQEYCCDIFYHVLMAGLVVMV